MASGGGSHGRGGHGYGHGYGHGGFPHWSGMMPPMYGYYGAMGMPQPFGMMPNFYGGYGAYGCPFMMHHGGMARHVAATHSTAKKCCDDCTCECCAKGCKCTGDDKCGCTCGCCKDGCCSRKGEATHQCPYLHGMHQCPFMMHHGVMGQTSASCPHGKKCCDDCTCDCCTKGCKCTGDDKCGCTCGCCKDGCCAKKGEATHQCPYLHGMHQCPFMMHHGVMGQTPASCPHGKKCCDDCTCECCTKGCKCTGDDKCGCTCGCCKDGCCVKKGEATHQYPFLHGMQARGYCPAMYGMHLGFMMPHTMIYPPAHPMVGYPRGCCGGEKKGEEKKCC